MKSAVPAATLASLLCACAPGTEASSHAAAATPTPVAAHGAAASPAVSGASAAERPAATATAPPKAAADRQVASAATPRADAAGDPQASPIPSLAPAAVPTVEVPAEAPAADATPASSLVVRAPDDPPEIVSFAISEHVVHPGDVLSGSVTASSNVASVEVRVAGYSYVMTKVAPGQFRLAATIPSVPKIFRRTYPLVAIARNARGDATQTQTQITLR